MKNKLGIFGALVLITFGVFMLIITGEVFFSEGINVGTFFLSLYGAIPIALGFYILLNLDKEDQIEQIKQRKPKRRLNK